MAARQFMELFPPSKRKTIFFKALNNKEINICLMEHIFFINTGICQAVGTLYTIYKKYFFFMLWKEVSYALTVFI